MTATNPSSSSKQTITDKLARQAMHRLAKKVEDQYERRFVDFGSAGDAFFSYMDKWDAKVTAELRKRPLSRAEINAIEARAFGAIRAKMLGVKLPEQKRTQEVVNIQTGETRRIPYVD
jgi:hypothetical protein